MSPEKRRAVYAPARLRFEKLIDDLRRHQEAPRKELTIVRQIDFSDKVFRATAEDSILTAVPIAPIIRKYLTLLGEDWPEGQGFIGGHYDEKSRELEHLFLGRVIESESGKTMTFGVRYSPKISEHLLFQVKTPKNSSLLNRLPRDHRENKWLKEFGANLSTYAPAFAIPDRI